MLSASIVPSKARGVFAPLGSYSWPYLFAREQYRRQTIWAVAAGLATR